MARTPGLALTAILLVGIGNAALALSLAWLYVVGLAPLPMRASEQLRVVWLTSDTHGSKVEDRALQGSVEAVERLLRSPPDRVRLAAAMRVLVQVGAGSRAQTQSWLRVTPGFWSVMGMPFRDGVPSEPDSGHVVLSAGAAARACGRGVVPDSPCSVEVDGAVMRVTAVLAPRAMPPLPLIQQRSRESDIAGYDTRTDIFAGLDPSARVEAVVVARSGLSDTQLRQRLQRQVVALGVTDHGEPMRVEVMPLSRYLRGAMWTATWALVVATVLNWAALALVLWAMLAAQFSDRAHDHFVLRSLGLAPEHIGVYDWTEVLWLNLLAALLSWGLAPVVVLLAWSNGWLPGSALIRVLPAAGVALVLLQAATLVVHRAAVRVAIREPSDAAALRNTRHSAAMGWRRSWLSGLQAALMAVACIAIVWAIPFGVEAWSRWKAARELRPAGLMQVEIRFPPGEPPSVVLDAVAQLSERLQRMPGVRRAAFGSVSAVDLTGPDVIHYSGPPYAEAGDIVSGDVASGDYVLRLPGAATDVRATSVDYLVQLAFVDPAFLALLHARTLQGHASLMAGSNDVVLNREASEALFPGHDRVAGWRVPGPIADTATTGWTNHLRVAGVVRTARVSTTDQALISMAPAVFLPLAALPTPAAERPRTLYGLIESAGPGTSLDGLRALQAVIGDVAANAVIVRIDALSTLVGRRVQQAVFASLGSGLLALILLLQFVLAISALARVALLARHARLAVCLAIGGDPLRLAWQETLAIQQGTWWAWLVLMPIAAGLFALGVLSGQHLLLGVLAALGLQALSMAIVWHGVVTALARAPAELLRDVG